ncbi:MerR family transcriptional regulator [Nocardia sp. NPDC052566]|uniref:MerR family transcriptional regulator n=1 Tax=Nocardia sp. NPDC052566 TaxID=3364330 RepID=UPI0037CA08BD
MAPPDLRPADLAAEHGLSTQAIRNYEDDGILPPSARTDSGYRRYTLAHAQALRAFLAMRRAYGHQRAATILRAAHRGDDATVFRIIDQAHTDALRERETLDDVAATLNALATAPTAPENPLTIGALAHQLGMHPASLRKWEQAGVLRPQRDPSTGYRVYAPNTVRDARIAGELRRGGYPLARIRLFLDELHTAGDTTTLADTLHEWRTRLSYRGRVMLSAGYELDRYLTMIDAT